MEGTTGRAPLPCCSSYTRGPSQWHCAEYGMPRYSCLRSLFVCRLRRSNGAGWCLFEVFTAIGVGATVNVELSPGLQNSESESFPDLGVKDKTWITYLVHIIQCYVLHRLISPSELCFWLFRPGVLTPNFDSPRLSQEAHEAFSAQLEADHEALAPPVSHDIPWLPVPQYGTGPLVRHVPATRTRDQH